MTAARFTKLITHGPTCSDGLASAMVARDALPEIEVVFAEHGTPSLEQLPATPGLLFCDISPPRARVAEFVEAGAVVLDHHKHARDIVEAFGASGHFADERSSPGVSGALLAYRNVWAPTRDAQSSDVETFARWVGIRDTWQTASPEWEAANDLHAALLGLPRAWWLRPGGIARALSSDTLELGRLWREQRARQVAELCTGGVIHLEDEAGRLWAVFPDGRKLVSDAAERLHQEGEDVTCGWFQVARDGELWTVLSLRASGALDVGALAKRLGGGGHSRAAGCQLRESDPLEAVRMTMAWACEVAR